MGRPPIKADGTPLTIKEKKQRLKAKKEAEEEARLARNARVQKSKAKKKSKEIPPPHVPSPLFPLHTGTNTMYAHSTPGSGASASSAGYSTDTSVASSAATEASMRVPPSPPVRQTVFITPGTGSMPSTPRSQRVSFEIPRTPLTAHQQGLLLKIEELKEARYRKRMEAIAGTNRVAMTEIGAAQVHTNAALKTAQDDTNAALKKAQDDTNAALKEVDDEANADNDRLAEALIYGFPLGGIPEEMEEEESIQPMKNLEAGLEYVPFHRKSFLYLSCFLQSYLFHCSCADKSASKPLVKTRKRAHTASKGKLNTSLSKKAKTASRSPEDYEIAPVFATQQLGLRRPGSRDILCLHEIFYPEHHWHFNLVKHIATIDKSLSNEKAAQRKYLLVGARDPTYCLVRQLGLIPTDTNGSITVSSFTLHVLEEEMPDPDYVFIGGENMVSKLSIGKGKVRLSAALVCCLYS